MTPRYCSFFSIYPRARDKRPASEFSETDVLVIRADIIDEAPIKLSILLLCSRWGRYLTRLVLRHNTQKIFTYPMK